ncbi:nucleotidyl transferase AbiEii/AbiGii toxin family protein [Methylobacillus sp. Pita2]|uniref:nucleotidyl transferase AbiEii/AbiGii toxin family protein n=1 Tax=Methylobacillus sp. Pita2 TaxID=3383245 RepID=UPI0038B5EA9B
MSNLRRKLRKSVEEIFDAQSIDVALATEILQARILHALFASLTRDLVIVKGGIAMQMLTGSNRATNDIDLAAEPNVVTNTLLNHMRQSIKQALKCGLLEKATFREQDTTGGGLSPKFHINGVLAGTQSNVHIKIEISKRDLLPEEGISRFEYTPPASSGLPPYLVRTYSPMAVAASKTAAMLDTKRYSPRDMYDLFVLMEMKVEAPVAMLAGLGSDEISRMCNYLWTKVGAFTYKEFVEKVAPHLPAEVVEGIDAKGWIHIQVQVGETLEKWLDQAGAIAKERIPRAEMRHHYDELKQRESEPENESNIDPVETKQPRRSVFGR